jgi:hypothetical protein
MAFSVQTTGYTQGAVDQAVHTVLVDFQGSWGELTPLDLGESGYFGFIWGIGAYTEQGPINAITGLFGFPSTSEYGTYNYTPGSTVGGDFIVQSALAADSNYLMRARGYGHLGDTQYGAESPFKSNAVDATSSAPVASGVTSVAANLSCDYYPNTSASTCTVTLQYKRSIDPGWTNAGASDAGISGYAVQNIARSISGLTPATQYDVRLSITRTTNNSTTFTSATTQFTTPAAAPTITTNPASNLSGTGATLNGTVNPNSIATTYYFDYGATSAYGSTTAVQGPNSGAVPVTYNAVIGPLTPNSIYHFRAHAVQGGVDYYGSDAVFSTDTQGHIMPSVYQNFAKYGAATDFYFCVEQPSASSSDRFLSAAVPWVAGDAQVDKDGGGLANVTNLPVRIGASPLYKWPATAAELTATKVNLLLIDVTVPPVWRDLHIQIETKLLLGQIDVDASGIGGNTSAMSLVGVGTGYGLYAQGSSGIRAQAGGVTSGHGFFGGGVGAGKGFAGAGVSNAFITNFWDQLEGPEPTAAPGNNESFGRILQYAKRRDVNKVTQDTGHQVWYRDNSTDILCQRVVSDDLITQIQYKLY